MINAGGSLSFILHHSDISDLLKLHQTSRALPGLSTKIAAYVTAQHCTFSFFTYIQY